MFSGPLLLFLTPLLTGEGAAAMLPVAVSEDT